MDNLINKLDEIIRWPKKASEKKRVIKWLATKFNFDKNYSEKEVNQIIKQHHLFDDIALLRRELIVNNLLNRAKDGYQYWKVD